MFKKSFNKGRLRSGFSSQNVIILLLFIALLFFVVYPLLIIFLNSFGVNIYGNSKFSFDYYGQMFRDKVFWKSFLNTVYTALLTVLFTVVRALIASWLVVRTDFKSKKFIKHTAFLSFTIPSYIIGISYLAIFTKGGYIDKLVTANGGAYSFSPYGILPTAIVMSIHLYPLVYFSLSSVLANIDPSLEDAAIMCGSSRFKAFITVTVPLLLPSIFTMGLFVLARTMSNFGVPSLLLMPSGKQTLSTMLYRSVAGMNFELLSAQSLMLLFFVGLVFILQKRILGNKSYSVASSGGIKKMPLKLGNWRYLAGFFVYLTEIIFTICPLIVIVMTSFLKSWNLPYKFENLSFDNYRLLFTQSDSMIAFRNSLFYGVFASVIAASIALFVAYEIHTSSSFKTNVLEFLASWPMATPNIVMAIGAILAWSAKPMYLYGTHWIVIITYISLFLPICLKNISGGMKNQDISLLNAARMSGSNSVKAFIDVVLPMVKTSLLSAILLSMLISFREIPIALTLLSKDTQTVGVQLFNMQADSSGLEATSALATVIIIISLILRFSVYLIKKGGKRNV